MQELSAIEMNYSTREIVDVFHGHAYTDDGDTFSRNHVHGLSQSFLFDKGCSTLEELIADFKQWLSGKNYLTIFGHNPQTEMQMLCLNIADIGLPPWSLRKDEAYHEVALKFKKLNIPINRVRCPKEAHAWFHGPCYMKNKTDGELAKARHGYHCSLYDAYELYLCYVMTD